MDKIKKTLTTLISGLVIFVVLAGATGFYNKTFLRAPLEDAVQKMPGIEYFEYQSANNRKKATVQFNVRSNLKSVFYLFLDKLEGKTNSRNPEITVEIRNQRNPELALFLKKANLFLYEAIDTGELSKLPARLDDISDGQNIVYDIEIDNNYIFLTANKEDDTAHLVICKENGTLQIINTMGGDYL